MAVTIEAVQTNELHLLTAISRETFYDTFHTQNSKENMSLFLEKNFTQETIAQEYRNSHNHFFFAKLDGQVAGYIKLTENNPQKYGFNSSLEIARLYAVTSRMGMGIGKAMMQFSLSMAKKLQKKTIWLGVWEHNDRAIQFYKKFGFEKFSQHIFMLGDDPQNDWLMKRDVEQGD